MTRVLVEALTRSLSESPRAAAATVVVQARNADGPYTNVTGAQLITSTRATVVVRGGQVFREDELIDGIPLVPTDGTFCYQWDVTSGGRQILTRTTSVPDVDTIDFGDLIDVDPETFRPTEDGVAAWEAVIAEAVAARDAATGSAGAAASSATSAAGSAATAVEAAEDAGTFAGATEFDANRAGQSAFQAGQSAASALGHRNDAKASADAASGSALSAGQAQTASEGAAVSAGSAASAAAGSASSAAASAGSASTAAGVAGQRAGEAASSATAAAGSALSADTARSAAAAERGGAEAARDGAVIARDAAYRGRPLALSTAPQGAGREYPVAVKPLNAPIFSKSASAAESIYWPWLVNLAEYGGTGVTLVYSTDHAAVHANSGIFEATSASPLQTFTDKGRTFRDDAGGKQTETPADIWDGTRWIRFYQQDEVGIGVQSTLYATAPPDRSTWTRQGIALQMASTDDAGDGHCGYFDPFRYAGGWAGFSLYGGTEAGRFAVWRSNDGVKWTMDPRLLGAAQNQITHLPGFTTNNWAVKWISGGVLEKNGKLWWVGMAGDRASAGAIASNRIITGPLRDDLRGFAERPVDITPPAQAWETTGIDNLGNLCRVGDRIFLPYRSGGQQGSFGMMEIV